MRNDIKRNLCASTRYANYVAQIMPLFTGNFGMTFAQKWTYRAPEIHRNGNESTFRRNIGHSDHFPNMTCPKHDISKYHMSSSNLHINSANFET